MIRFRFRNTGSRCSRKTAAVVSSLGMQQEKSVASGKRQSGDKTRALATLSPVRYPVKKFNELEGLYSGLYKNFKGPLENRSEGLNPASHSPVKAYLIILVLGISNLVNRSLKQYAIRDMHIKRYNILLVNIALKVRNLKRYYAYDLKSKHTARCCLGKLFF
jgi:hypothetical protein